MSCSADDRCARKPRLSIISPSSLLCSNPNKQSRPNRHARAWKLPGLLTSTITGSAATPLLFRLYFLSRTAAACRLCNTACTASPLCLVSTAPNCTHPDRLATRWTAATTSCRCGEVAQCCWTAKDAHFTHTLPPFPILLQILLLFEELKVKAGQAGGAFHVLNGNHEVCSIVIPSWFIFCFEVNHHHCCRQ